MVAPDEFVPTSTATTVPSPWAVTATARLGLETMIQLVPLQCSINVLLKPSKDPTAHTSLQAEAAKPVKVPRWESVVPISGER
jgi:hypothetical protein